ncbi:nitroreductase [Coriobacterium glomerans PW2]|uniref:Nitroreductase n=1 Tax=Coriobacterium glomerans (strain ATCC 49209 / DSM 20642 / JCM 10262 / PW2) TaxID=700015 RepID=F2NBN4_CORGP|nr:nitroreductase family protein [Coriobacterium glomerans]AEB06843.1 nitroreductase [Coriobacterium glomerans PW2]
MSFLDLARERYSERRFAPKPVETEKLEAILEAGRLAPTARNSQPQRILVIQSPKGLKEMDRCTPCRFGAPLVLVLGYDITCQAYNPDVVEFGIVDTTIVATHMMLEAQQLGVHSCWVGMIDPSELRRRFNIPGTQRIISVMPMGYPADGSCASALHETSLPIEKLVAYERYQSTKRSGTAS